MEPGQRIINAWVLTLDCNTFNHPLSALVIWEQVQDSHWVCKGRWVSTVFDGFQRFSMFSTVSIVFNVLAYMSQHTGSNVVCDSEVFFFSFNIIYLLFSFLVCIPKTTTGLPGVLGFCLLTPTV